MSKKRLIPKLATGYRIREYEVLRLLSEGGQGRVYLGRLVRDDQTAEQFLGQLKNRLTSERVAALGLCVIKVPHPDSVDNVRDEQIFLSDPQISHTRVITLFKPTGDRPTQPRGQLPGLCFSSFAAADGTMIDNHPCLLLTYEPGGSLRDLMRQVRDEAVPPGAAVLIGRQIAEALQHLHEVAQIVHHDISPSNIVLRSPPGWPASTRPDCILVDFAAADSLRYTRQREVLAQPRYRAPERGAPERGMIDTPPDIYSLGVVLYELLAGRAAVPTGRVTNEAGKDEAPGLPPLAEKAPQLSAALCDLVMAMVDADPAARPTAAAVRASLEAVPEALLPAELRGPPPPNLMRNLAVAVGTLAATAALGLGLMLATQTPVPPSIVTPVATVTPLSLEPTATTATAPIMLTSTPALGVPRP